MTMRRANAFLMLSVLVAPTLLAGCLTSAQGTRDWWGGNGSLVVTLGTLPATAPGQRMQDFSSLRIAIESVVAYPPSPEVAPIAGVVYTQPMGIDLRKRFDEKEGRVVLERYSIAMKAVSHVDVKLVFVSATDTAGNDVPFCPTGAPAPRKPCVAIDRTGTYTLDKRHDPPRMERAKTMTMEFPIAVVYNATRQEYFLQSRSADSEASVTFTRG